MVGVNNQIANINAGLNNQANINTSIGQQIDNLNKGLSDIGQYGSKIGYYDFNGTKQSSAYWDTVLTSGEIERGNSVMLLAFNWASTMNGAATLGIMVLDSSGKVLVRDTRYKPQGLDGFNTRQSISWLFKSTDTVNTFIIQVFNNSGVALNYDGMISILYLHS